MATRKPPVVTDGSWPRTAGRRLARKPTFGGGDVGRTAPRTGSLASRPPNLSGGCPARAEAPAPGQEQMLVSGGYVASQSGGTKPRAVGDHALSAESAPRRRRADPVSPWQPRRGTRRRRHHGHQGRSGRWTGRHADLARTPPARRRRDPDGVAPRTAAQAAGCARQLGVVLKDSPALADS